MYRLVSEFDRPQVNLGSRVLDRTLNSIDFLCSHDTGFLSRQVLRVKKTIAIGQRGELI